MQTNKCDGLKVGDIVSFDAEIVVTSCPTNPEERHQRIYISPVGIDEKLIVDIEMLCSCDCESSGPTFEPYSPICKEQGTLSCGICECHEGYFGHNCECIAYNDHQVFQCRPDNVTDIDCSDRGACVCGQCHCNPRENPEEKITGKYCECDNFSCDRNHGVLCSGPEYGICDCGTCRCRNGRTGDACECDTSVDKCMGANGEICSGHGMCNCGRCECDITDEVRYSGALCDKCPTCPGRCDELRACVECQMYQKGPLKDPNDCQRNCSSWLTLIPEENVECKF